MDYETMRDTLRGHRKAAIESGASDEYIQAIDDTLFTLKEYVDPWSCSICGHTVKVPPDPKRKTLCPKCGRKSMMAYGYKEHRRMSRLLTYIQKNWPEALKDALKNEALD